MKFDEDLEAYVYEIDGVIMAWGEEPENDYEDGAKAVVAKYKEHLPHIIQFMFPDLKMMYGEINVNEVEENLGKPVIYVDGGVVTYLEQTFDDVHIFSFEFLDEDFNDLQYFTIDG